MSMKGEFGCWNKSQIFNHFYPLNKEIRSHLKNNCAVVRIDFCRKTYMALVVVEKEKNTVNPGIERVQFGLKKETIFFGVDLVE